jgi:hypothetical protein
MACEPMYMYMSLIQRIVQLLTSREEGLRAYELDIITSIHSIVSPLARTIIQAQLDEVAFIQRHAIDKEVNLYPQVPQQSGDSARLPSPFPEWPIGVVYCSAPAYPSLVRATLWIASGRVFSIVFGQSPVAHSVRVVRAHVLFDPTMGMQQLRSGVPEMQYHEPASDDPIPGLDSRAVQPRLVPDLRERFLIPAKLCTPTDYCEVLTRTNGCQVGKWRINGLPLREVAMEGSNLFVLAESHGAELLCALDGDLDKNTYLWNIEEDKGTVVGPSFVSALKTLN